MVLTDAGKNPSAVTNLLTALTLTGLTKDQAEAVSGKITAAGGKVETHIVPIGSDLDHGWGVRRSVAEDFLYDNPVQLGGLRAGPDLANIGLRSPDANWHLLHLYAPRSVNTDSKMPSKKSARPPHRTPSICRPPLPRRPDLKSCPSLKPGNLRPICSACARMCRSMTRRSPRPPNHERRIQILFPAG